MKIRSFRSVLIIIMSAVAVIPVFAVSIPLIRTISGLVEVNAVRELSLTAGTISQDLQHEMRMALSQSQALSRDSDIQRATTSILFSNKADFLMVKFLENTPFASAVFLINDRFQLNTSVPISPEKAGTTTANKEQFRKIFEGEITDTPGYFRFILDGERILLGVPVISFLGRPTGAIVVEFPISQIKSMVAPRVKPPMIAMLDLTSPAKSQEETKGHVLARAPFSIKDFYPSHDIDFTITVAEPRSTRFAIVRDTVLRVTLISLAIALCLVIISYYLAQLLNRPLNILSGQVRQYESGNYTQPKPHMRFQEFQAVLDTLSSMGSKIQSQLEETAERERLRGEIERTKLETELLSLHRQMQPHFLFNTLNNISTMIQIDPATSSRLITKLSDLYRLILETSKHTTIPIDKEIQIASYYLDLQKMRFMDRLTYDVSVPSDFSEVHIPGMLIQTLVENSVKHGIAKAREGGHILIDIRKREDGWYYCEVANTGAPFASCEIRQGSTDAAASSGTGLQNTRKRLELLYGSRNHFEIGTTADGKTVASFCFSGERL